MALVTFDLQLPTLSIATYNFWLWTPLNMADNEVSEFAIYALCHLKK